MSVPGLLVFNCCVVLHGNVTASLAAGVLIFSQDTSCSSSDVFVMCIFASSSAFFRRRQAGVDLVEDKELDVAAAAS